MLEPELFTRHAANPILTPRGLPYPCTSVCNPGACLVNGEAVLLLRVIDTQDMSHITVARSRDGVGDWRFDPQPLLAPGRASPWYDSRDCEDPRVTFLPDRDEYGIAYVGFSPYGAAVCCATTRDFESAERFGVVLPPYNKDAVLFPRRINGHYFLLHRPTSGALEDIWLAEGDNLTHWGQHRCILEKSAGTGWDGGKVGAGPPPIETPEGWLLIFHGAQQSPEGWVYRVGLALLDLEDPSKVIARTRDWVFAPKAPYERGGVKPGVIFPTGTIVRDGVLSLYYGADDTGVALATAKIDSLLEALQENRV